MHRLYHVIGLYRRMDVSCLQQRSSVKHELTRADVGGFRGEWQKAPSGVNQSMKLEILAKEGVKFDAKGMLMDKSKLWDGW